MIRFVKKYYPSLLIALVIMWLSLSESGPVNPGRFFSFPNADKLAHFLLYLFFTAILLVNSSGWRISGEIRFLVVIIPVALGLCLEILQVLITATRQAEFLDFVSNVTGITVATIIVLLLKSALKNKGRIKEGV